MNLNDALNVLEIAKKEALKSGIPMTIAVYNSKEEMLAYQKMDNAVEVSVKLAPAKAITALRLGCDTDNVSYLGLPTGILSNLFHDENLSFYGGGKLLVSNGEIVGSIGVSGGPENIDVEIAYTASTYFI